MRRLGRFFRQTIFTAVLGVGEQVWRFLTDSNGNTIQTSSGQPLATSEDLRFIKTRSGRILTTSDGRPFYTKVS